jgi:hypothetical protein
MLLTWQRFCTVGDDYDKAVILLDDAGSQPVLAMFSSMQTNRVDGFPMFSFSLAPSRMEMASSGEPRNSGTLLHL